MADEGGPRLEFMGKVMIHGSDGQSVAVGRPQVAAVLAMLWDERRPVRREELADLLWGDWNYPDHWTGAVRGVLAKVRRVLARVDLAPQSLQSSAGIVELHLPDTATSDLHNAEVLVTNATRAIGDHDLALAERLAREGLSILSQPVAVSGEGEWLRRLHLRADTFDRQARHVVARSLLGQGLSAEAIAMAEAAIEHDPLDESAYETLIEAHLTAGRPAAAQSVHAAMVTKVGAELGVEPATPMVQLLDRATESGPRIITPVHRPPSEPFLGRLDELERLHDRFVDTVESGRPNLALVTGPPGIGKTRLVEEFVARTEATHLWGRCHGDAGEPFEPIAEAFRRSADSVRSSDGFTGNALGRAVAFFDELPDSTVTTHGRTTRARIVQAVVAAVQQLGSSGPIVLVVDDLHWASGDSLSLLARIVSEAAVPLLVVATSRDEVSEPAPLAELLRAAPSSVVPLGAIGAADLKPLTLELANLMCEPHDVDQLVDQLWRRTGGLPYYISEVVRDARRRNRFSISTIPEQVRTWMQSRIASLPDDIVTLAEVAAVIVHQPSVPVIVACWVGPDDRAMAGIERLIRSGLLIETDRPDEVAFAHQITRDVVLDRISAPRLAGIHSRVALALNALHADEQPHARIAHHYANSTVDHRIDAARHGYLAGVQSLARGAWELADEQFGAALDHLGTDRVPIRASTLIAQGWTRHASGEAAEAVELLNEATDLAAELRLPHQAARAALLLVGRAGRGAAYGMTDVERIARLQAALRAVTEFDVRPLDHHTSAFPLDEDALAMLQTAVEVELAWAMLFTGSLEERTELLTATLRRARADGAGPQRLARALLAQRNILSGAGQSDARLAVIEETLALPRRELPDETVGYALLARHEELLMRGDRRGARAALDEVPSAISPQVHPYWKWAAATWESLWLLIDGNPEAAEAALGEASMIQDRSPEAAACAAVQLVAIRLAQGRASEMVDLLAVTASAQPEIPCYAAVLALALSLAGDLESAEAAYQPFAQAAFENIPVDSNRFLTLAVLGDVAASLGDEKGAAALDPLLAPDDALFVVLNCYGGGGAWWGPVARIRARLAEVRGRHDEAQACRRRAAAMVERFGASTAGQPEG